MRGVTLILIPSLNPDGLARGDVASGRFNANGVDLNRNWDCGWVPDAVWRENSVDPGQGAFSEPETLALAALIYDIRPDAVLFYHAAASGVFAGECNDDDSGSAELARVVGEATNYTYGDPFTDYAVTGTAPSWAAGIGVPAVDVELATTESSEFTRNLQGVMAVQAWVVSGE